MALYCEITDVTRPNPLAIMSHFQVLDDATTPATVVIASATHGFDAVLRDGAGAIVPETQAERRARLKAEFDAYAQRIIDAITASATGFDTLRTAAIGYRFPA